MLYSHYVKHGCLRLSVASVAETCSVAELFLLLPWRWMCGVCLWLFSLVYGGMCFFCFCCPMAAPSFTRLCCAFCVLCRCLCHVAFLAVVFPASVFLFCSVAFVAVVFPMAVDLLVVVA